MVQKIYDSELKVMELIWEHQPISAKQVSVLAAEKYAWNVNTTYTVIKKTVAKGYVRRSEPGFMCTALITREEARRAETQGLINKLFGGSRKALFSSLLEDESLTQEELEELRQMIEKR